MNTYTTRLSLVRDEETLLCCGNDLVAIFVGEAHSEEAALACDALNDVLESRCAALACDGNGEGWPP